MPVQGLLLQQQMDAANETDDVLTSVGLVAHYVLSDYLRVCENIEMIDDVLELVEQVLQCSSMLAMQEGEEINNLYLKM